LSTNSNKNSSVEIIEKLHMTLSKHTQNTVKQSVTDDGDNKESKHMSLESDRARKVQEGRWSFK
jgi:hypothetical protein